MGSSTTSNTLPEPYTKTAVNGRVHFLPRHDGRSYLYFIKSGSVRLLLNTLCPIPEAILLRLQPPRDYVIVMFEREMKKPQMPTTDKPNKALKHSLSSGDKSDSSQSITQQTSNVTFAQKHRLHVPQKSLPLCVSRGEKP